MYSRLPALCIFVAVIFFSSCSKDSGPPPPPPVLDTLSAGWQRIEVPGAKNLMDIFFVNNNVGWVVGDYVYKSIDGGLTWNKQTVGNDATGFGNLFFINDQVGFVMGTKLYRTQNGGTSWEEVIVAGAGRVADVQFLDDDIGFLVSDGGLFRSEDGGSNWTKVPATFSPNGTLYFLNESEGWVSGSINKVAYTDNGGLDFTISNAFTGQGIYAMQFIDPDYGWTAGYSGVWRTTDGGANWMSVVKERFSDIHFFNKNDGFICHGNVVYTTNNGGQTLTRVVKIAQTEGLVELHFTDPNHGWVVSYENFILRYAQ